MEHIKELQEIDRSTKEGQYLMAAIAVLATELGHHKTPNEVLADLTIVKDRMYEPGDDPDLIQSLAQSA